MLGVDLIAKALIRLARPLRCIGVHRIRHGHDLFRALIGPVEWVEWVVGWGKGRCGAHHGCCCKAEMEAGCGAQKYADAAAHTSCIHKDDVETRSASSGEEQLELRADHKQLEVTTCPAAARLPAARDGGVEVVWDHLNARRIGRCLGCLIRALVGVTLFQPFLIREFKGGA